jgi:hypothetical protein
MTSASFPSQINSGLAGLTYVGLIIRAYACSLTSWTVNIPSGTSELQLQGQFPGLSTFTPDMTNNTNLRILYLQNNNLTTIPLTLSLCSTLQQLNVSQNSLTSLPTLPNTIQTLAINWNSITSLPNIPTSLVTIVGGLSNDGTNNSFTTFNYTLTNSLSLTTFTMNRCSISTFSSQFPTSIRTIILDNNTIASFNMSLITVGCTSLSMASNVNLTTLTNTNSATGLQTLNLQSCNFTNQNNIIAGDINQLSSLISLTLSLAKSAQFLIPLGLPSRVTKAATDLETIPLLGNFFSHPG